MQAKVYSLFWNNEGIMQYVMYINDDCNGMKKAFSPITHDKLLK